ncbi:hypothetical protein C8R44DRAFT_724131 [Mycena epipterygia]|nr:hypothetical protein C8R44DRAFT_724131 [Mycena epipterygia]
MGRVNNQFWLDQFKEKVVGSMTMNVGCINKVDGVDSITLMRPDHGAGQTCARLRYPSEFQSVNCAIFQAKSADLLYVDIEPLRASLGDFETVRIFSAISGRVSMNCLRALKEGLVANKKGIPTSKAWNKCLEVEYSFAVVLHRMRREVCETVIGIVSVMKQNAPRNLHPWPERRGEAAIIVFSLARIPKNIPSIEPTVEPASIVGQWEENIGSATIQMLSVLGSNSTLLSPNANTSKKLETYITVIGH